MIAFFFKWASIIFGSTLLILLVIIIVTGLSIINSIKKSGIQHAWDRIATNMRNFNNWRISNDNNDTENNE